MDTYSFNISLSVLNHLGRNLYRSFITVVGEAISNAWDADAHNVYINIDRSQNRFIIKDDGLGMDSNDFQNKFLKIGYSKRKEGANKTSLGRPFIGRKGIGKLALLSCAQRITVISKKQGQNIVGGIIDNQGLDKAIKEDVSTNDYQLIQPTSELLKNHTIDTTSGTIIIFDGLNEGIKNRVEYIRKLIALYFRFSLLDESFNIILNGERITLNELQDLLGHTQLLWTINNTKDPFIKDYLKEQESLRHSKDINIDYDGIHGFIASVDKPSMLKVRGTDEKATIDLYVNGRLREKDILKHIPTARIVESYLYGQIHYDNLDDSSDRFTSSREGIVPDDPKFKGLLEELSKLLKTILKDWDNWRLELKLDGDSENTETLPLKTRKSMELFNVVSEDFIKNKKSKKGEKTKVEKWIDELSNDAAFNFESYGECFIAENLLRNYVIEKKIAIPKKLGNDIVKWKKKAEDAKDKANISFEIREKQCDLSFCDMDSLAGLADTEHDKIAKANLLRDSAEYKPIRDAMSHTSRLTSMAKNRLSCTYENIKARIVKLLDGVS